MFLFHAQIMPCGTYLGVDIINIEACYESSFTQL